MALGQKDLEKIVANPTPGKQKTYKHELGLNLRESQNDNVLTWEGRITFESKQFRINYGTYPQMSLRDAEDAHKETRQLAKEGIDPRLERSKQNVNNVEELCLRWLKLYARVQRKRPEIPERDILKDIIPAIGHIKLTIFRKPHVNACIDPIIERGSSAHAKKVFGLLRQICIWGVEKDYLQQNPTENIKKANIHKSEPRKRALKKDEIAAVWHKLPKLGLSAQVVLACKILLLTGQRRREITFATWKNIDFKKKIWLIPKTDTKNSKLHQIPLSNFAIEIFKELKFYAGDSAFVMPSHTPNSDSHMSEKAITRAIARKQKDFDMEHWTPHDLRRTFITRANSVCKAPHLTELIVNHSLPDMLKVYVSHEDDEDLFEMQRELMEMWAKHVQMLVNQ